MDRFNLSASLLPSVLWASYFEGVCVDLREDFEIFSWKAG